MSLTQDLKRNKEPVAAGVGIASGVALYISLNTPSIVFASCVLFAVAVATYVYTTLKKA